MVVGFNVRPVEQGPALAERGRPDPQYRVIYELTQEIEQALVGMLSPVATEAMIGEVEVRALFPRLPRRHDRRLHGHERRRPARLARADLPRRAPHPRDDGRAVEARSKTTCARSREGFECGILLEGFNDLREGDIFEVYETREVERTSLDEPAPTPA